jgi:O-antigen/teichoic acid export membrane protein
MAPSIGRSALVRAASRLGWGLTDQTISSLTNFVCAATAAHVLSTTELGAYSLAFVTYAVALNCSRGLATDPLMVRHRLTDASGWRRAIGQSSGTALMVGVLAGVLMIAAATFLPAPTKGALIGMGLVIPLLLLQDSWRFAFFVAGRGPQALLNDLVWGLSLIPALILLVRTSDPSAFGFVLAWGGAAGVAAGVGIWQTRVFPWPRNAVRWLRTHRDLGLRYMLEGMSGSLANQLVAYGVGVVVGLTGVAHLQLLNTLMGLFSIVMLGTGAVIVPELAMLLRESPRRMQHACLLLSGGLAAVAVGWGVIVWASLPHGLGQAMVGPGWTAVHSLVLIAALALVCGSPAAGAGGGLHALGAARRSLRAMVVGGASKTCLAIAGAVVGGVRGALIGTAVATTLSSCNWWRELRAGVREHESVNRAQTSPTYGDPSPRTVGVS